MQLRNADDGFVGNIDDDLIPLSERLLNVNGAQATPSNVNRPHNKRKRAGGETGGAKRKRNKATRSHAQEVEDITEVPY